MLFAIAAAIGVFGACGLLDTPVQGGSATIIVGERSFELEDIEAGTTLGNVLDKLAADGEIVFEYTQFSFGRQLDVLGGLVPGVGEFIAVYLTASRVNLWAVTPTTEVDGVIFWSANVGIDAMPIFDGTTYLFRIEGW